MREDATFETEQGLWEEGHLRVAGVDEVGRGSWAGPLLVAAAGVGKDDSSRAPAGLRDSKMLSPAVRVRLSALVLEWVPVGLGWVTNVEIDSMGMAAALRVGALRALDDLAAQGFTPDAVIQDGSAQFVPQQGRVLVMPKADATCVCVAAASVVAKVARDNWMHQHASLYPQHPALGASSGYGTAAHRESLLAYGPTEIHRVSFKLPGLEQQLRA